MRELALKLLALPELVLAPNVAQFVHLFQAVKLCSQRSDHNLVWSNGFLQPVPGNG